MQVSAVNDTRIQSADFGDYHYVLLLAWAFVERQSKAQFLRNVAVARVEKNRPQIDDGLKFYAGRFGITPDELMKRIAELDGEKKQIGAIHEILLEEARDRGIDI